MKILQFAASACLLLAATATLNAQTVFTGLDFAFERPASSEMTGPSDQVTDGVAFARNITSGLFNSAVSSAFDPSGPTGTQWATALNNPDDTIQADNFADLTFVDWQVAFGGMGELASNILSLPAVVHLVEEDIYFEIQFTAWTIGSGGGFAYNRSVVELNSDVLAGDYNSDGVVDAADYLTFRDNLGGTGSLANETASPGVVDTADFQVFVDSFGAGVPTFSASVAVPEPSGVALLLLCSLGLMSRRSGQKSFRAGQKRPVEKNASIWRSAR